MQENNLNTIPEQPETFVPSTPIIKSKSNPVLIILSSFLIALVLLTGFLAYQNYQLQKQINLLTAVTPTPSSTATTDPTANWKTITNILWSFKVPANLNYFECSSHDSIFVGSPNALSGRFNKDQTIECNFDQPGDLLNVFRGLHNSGNNIIIPTNTDPKIDPVVSEKSIVEVGGSRATFQKETTQFGQGTGSRYKVYVDNTKYTDVITFNDLPQKELFLRILSTFNFINSTASPSAKPVACTQEAKLCPGGTYVGRTGPNCEFAPCP